MIESLSLLVHAFSKVGKTTLAATSPAPICMLDAEGGAKFLRNAESLVQMYGRPIELREWVPTEPPPRYDGTWDICIVNIRDWQTVTQVYNWLSQAEHDFQSLVVDSITEVQRRCKQQLKGTEALKIQDWGTLLVQMDMIIRGFRDLTLHPVRPLRVVVFIAETRQSQAGKWKPYMQGQIEVALPYWMDIVGYLYIEMLQNAQGQPTIPVRRLLIGQNQMYEAGERVQGRLGTYVDNPNIFQMYSTIFSPNGSAPVVPAETAPPQ